jgi:hypothetical protein
MELTFLDIFIIFVVIIIIFLYIKRYYGEVAYVRSNIDNKKYLVRKLPDSQEAADLLAKINIDLSKLVKFLMANYPDDPRVKLLYQNYNPDNISEGTPEHGYTSYSINKGEKLILCIRQKDTDELVDKNTILYVAIHELGHLMTDEIGHTPKFWENFKWILNQAVDQGIYKKVDYKKSPKPYCGIKLTSSVI